MRVAERVKDFGHEFAFTILQWGRNMRVAESAQFAQDVLRGGSPSMGPQHESCGKHAGRGNRNFEKAFNGAAT